MESFGIETDGCPICEGSMGDAKLKRVLVWEDRLWRLTMSLYSEIPGFSYLEPKRHIPYMTDLDGEEARTLGVVLARATRVLRRETGADLVFIYVFGGHIPHVHFHLAPHVKGDPLNTDILSREAPLVPEGELRALADRVHRSLATERRASSKPSMRG